jgi:hypothetical protein
MIGGIEVFLPFAQEEAENYVAGMQQQQRDSQSREEWR